MSEGAPRSNLSSVVDGLYTNFLMRDLLGKVVPGGIAVIPFLSLVKMPSAGDIPEILVATVGFGLFWGIGYAVQTAGALSGITRYYRPVYFGKGAGLDIYGKKKKAGRRDDDWRTLRRAYKEQETQAQQREFERMVVITEACANACIAILFAVIASLALAANASIAARGPLFLSVPAAVQHNITLLHWMGLALFVLLWWGHAEQRAKKCNFMIEILKERGWKPSQ